MSSHHDDAGELLAPDVAGVRVRTVQYGEQPHLLLDVYSPRFRDAAAQAPLPIIVFCHGGGWKAFSRRPVLGVLGDVGRSFARRGFVVVSVDYTLSRPPRFAACMCYLGVSLAIFVVAVAAYAAAARGRFLSGAVAGLFAGAFLLVALADPCKTWRRGCRATGEMVSHPRHCLDVAAAVAWTVAHAAEVGGDARRIALLGHSAGAHIALQLALQPEEYFARAATPLARPHEHVRAIVGISGVYCADLLEARGTASAPFRRFWYLRAAFGPDRESWAGAFPCGVLRARAERAAREAPAARSAGGAGALPRAASWRPPVLLTNAATGDWGLEKHSEALMPMLREAGFDVEYFVLKGAGHVTELLGIGVPCTPSERLLVPRVLRFLEPRLRPRPGGEREVGAGVGIDVEAER